MAKLNVRVLMEARLQLRDIASIYKLKVGPKAAKRITDRILNAIDNLSHFPDMGANPPGKMLVDAGYKMLIVEEYLCFYYVIDEMVYVSHIVHGSTDYIHIFLK